MNNEAKVLDIFVEDIIPNRFQPRLAFDDAKIEELASSIKNHGIIQPLVLRQVADKYEIIAGERRYKAAILAGLQKVPAIISNLDDNQSAEVALVENIQRRDLSAIEEAKSFKKLLDRGYLTQDQLATRMGISQSTMSNKMRLLNLDESVQRALLEEKISERHARSMLAINDFEKQRELLNIVLTNRLTVRQLDEEIKKMINNIPINNEYNIEKLDVSSAVDQANIVDLTPTFKEEPSIVNENVEVKKSELSSLIDLSQIASKPSNEFFPTEKLDDLPVNSSPLIFDDLLINKPMQTFPNFTDKSDDLPKLIRDDSPEESNVSEPVELPAFDNNNISSQPEELTFKIDKNNFRTVEQAYEKIKNEIEAAGLKINMDAYSFDEYYQLIIKVYK